MPPSGDLLDTLRADSQFTKFVSLIDQAGLDRDLRNTGTFTIFAPTNEVGLIDMYVLYSTWKFSLKPS